MTVLAVEPKGDKGAAIMTMADGRKVWTPEIEKAKALIGQPIPADWFQKEGDYGPQAFPPKQGKGGGGRKGFSRWTDSEAGFYVSDERIDRRRSAELAIKDGVFNWSAAEEIYMFLRTTSGSAPKPTAPNAPERAEGHTSGAPTSGNYPFQGGTTRDGI